MATGHHTKDKGDLAVAKVHADLVERGATVLIPLTEHAPFDLVAYYGGVFYRVQVKFRRAANGRVTVEFGSSWADRHGSHHRPMPRDEVDAVALYCPDTKQTYYLNPSNFGTRVSLRLEPTKNGQRLRILHAATFLSFPPAESADPSQGISSGGQRLAEQVEAVDHAELAHLLSLTR